MHNIIIIHSIFWVMIIASMVLSASLWAHRIRNAKNQSLSLLFLGNIIFLMGVLEYQIFGKSGLGGTYMYVGTASMLIACIYVAAAFEKSYRDSMSTQIFLILYTCASILTLILHTQNILTLLQTILVHSILFVVGTGGGCYFFIHKILIYKNNKEHIKQRRLTFFTFFMITYTVMHGILTYAFMHTSLAYFWISIPVISGVLVVGIVYFILRNHIIEIAETKRRAGMYIASFVSYGSAGGILIYTLLVYIAPETLRNTHEIIHLSTLILVSILIVGYTESLWRKRLSPFLNQGNFSLSYIFEEVDSMRREHAHPQEITARILNLLEQETEASFIRIVEERDLTQHLHTYMYPLYNSEHGEQITYILIGPKEGRRLYTEAELRHFAFTAHYLSILMREYALTQENKHLEGRIEKYHTDRRSYVRSVHKQQNKVMTDIAHNLQTPLTIARTEVALIKQRMGAQPWIHSFEQALENISSFMYRLLRSTQADTQARNHRNEAINLSIMMDHLIREFKKIAPEYRAHIHQDITPRLGIHGSPQEIEEAIANVINNALKYGKPHQENTIRISLDTYGDDIRIRISDTGIGISPADQDNIFEKLYRSERASKHGQGTGLGLYIAINTIKKHNGTITVASEMNVGTTFTIRFPQKRADA
ncbi:MAG: HAMP domain-containing histidine kinase [Candidatus Pacebacteria bacterium]|nr:HAMP domain-containing histidine kinase [Candidatus Paceibacterota bacterium]MCD8528303.1 HAMP domain-containing histidine kinase [Candidatus Paceibacterota bacterium]MCD8563409.1 HAMP domain-containing histidine kinase [Candidatus Paceibacterota bacterium]